MEGFIGEIRFFAGNFAPRSWAFCEGQLLAISQNSALFSILGTTYGGDGRTTFGLPDLRGRVAVGQGNGPGLNDRPLGQKGGSEHNVLNTTQIPSHTHTHAVNSSSTAAANTPSGNYPAPLNVRASGLTIQSSAYGTSTDGTMNSGMLTLGNTGGSQSMNNMMPWISFYYIIALFGTYPSRS